MIRQRICEGSAWAGVKLNQDANTAQVSRISTEDSEVSVWVIPTDEEQIIASHTASLVANHRATIQALS